MQLPVPVSRLTHPNGLAGSYYVLEPSRKPVTILFNLKLLERLKDFITEKARRGREAGGILLGRCEEHQGRSIVTVENCEPFESAASGGALKMLSDKENKRLRKRLAWWRSSKEPDLQVVGLVRSHQQPALYKDAADFSLFESEFTVPSSFFLLVRPGPRPLGGLFFRSDNGAPAESDCLEFPLDREQLEKGGYTILRMMEAPPKEERETAVVPLEKQPQSPWLSALHGRKLAWAAVMAAVLVLVPLSWYQVRHQAGSPSAEAVAAPFQLNLENAGDVLRVMWNPNSPAVQGADHGVLRISDGDSVRRVNLDAAQLGQGAVSYKPHSNTVDFRLDVFKGKNTVVASVHGVVPVREEVVAPGTPVEKASMIPAAKAPAPKREAHATAPSVASKAAPEASQPRRPASIVTVTYRSPSDSRVRRAFGKVPGLRRLMHFRKNDEMVPATPIRKIAPGVPETVARELPGEWRVDLKASIDGSGKVTSVAPVSARADERLVELASNAVNKWRFEPARLNGKKTASDLILTFHFWNNPIRQEPNGD